MGVKCSVSEQIQEIAGACVSCHTVIDGGDKRKMRIKNVLFIEKEQDLYHMMRHDAQYSDL